MYNVLFWCRMSRHTHNSSTCPNSGAKEIQHPQTKKYTLCIIFSISISLSIMTEPIKHDNPHYQILNFKLSAGFFHCSLFVLQIEAPSATKVSQSISLYEDVSCRKHTGNANEYRKSLREASEHSRKLQQIHFFFIKKKIKAFVSVIKVDSECVCAAPGLYPLDQVCYPSAVLTETVAAAPGSLMTYSPSARSLAPSHKHKQCSEMSFYS